MRELIPLRRLLAGGLDILILLLASAGWLLLTPILPSGLRLWLGPLLGLGLAGLWLGAEVRSQGSPGKALLGLRLVYPRPGWLWMRVLLRNLLKYGILLLTAWLAFELFPHGEPALTSLNPSLRLGLLLLWFSLLALLMNFWILSPRMQQFWPGKCLHEWLSGSELRALPRAELPRRITVSLLAILLLICGLIFSAYLMLPL